MNQNNVSQSETTIDDVLGAIHGFAIDVQEKFNKIDVRLDKVEKDIVTIKSTMVTKSYLDDKLADLRGDIVVIVRKEDTKLKSLVEILLKKKILSEDEVKTVYALEPFAQMI